eukprot:Clim_evm11s233 gene=Clim_evmTU11s233
MSRTIAYVAIAALGLGLFAVRALGSSKKWTAEPHRKHLKVSACDEKFAKVLDLFRRRIESGEDLGGSVCVWVDGKCVLDAVGGSTSKGTPVMEDTIGAVFSASKVHASLVIAMLVDRGLLDYDRPICHYWPEFAKNGKEKITVGDLMSHRAGLAVTDEPFRDPTLLYKHRRAELRKFLERQKPCSYGETFYHPFMRGIYASQLVEMVDPKGRTLGEFYRDEVARVLGADFHIGTLPQSEESRIATICMPPAWYEKFVITPQVMVPLVWSSTLRRLFNPKEWLRKMDIDTMFGFGTEGSPGWRTTAGVMPSAEDGKSMDLVRSQAPIYTRGEWPCSHGLGNARAMATVGAALAHDGALNGKRLLSEEFMRTQAYRSDDGEAWDGNLHRKVDFTQPGWAHFESYMNGGIEGYGWMGYGGCYVIWHPKYKMSFSYVPMSTNARAIYGYRGSDLLKMTYEILRS